MGADRRRPALQRAAGRRAAGQPQRRAQRDRVLRVRAGDAGLRRPLGRDGRAARHARGRGARQGARRLRQPARRAAHRAPARQRRGVVAGLSPADRGAPRLRARHRCRAAWCSRRPKKTRRRCWCCRSTRRRRCPTSPSSPRCAMPRCRSTCRRPAESAEPFAAWQQRRASLADDMDATLVDDQGHAGHAARVQLDRQRAEADVPRARGARPGGRLGLGAAACSADPRSSSVHAPRQRAQQAQTPRPTSDAPPSWRRSAPWWRRRSAPPRGSARSRARRRRSCARASTRSLASSTSSFM